MTTRVCSRRWLATAPASGAGGRAWPAALIAGARFVCLTYLLVVVLFALAAVVPVLVARWQPLVVVSGSMQPALSPGAMVLVDRAVPDQHYAAPSIVTFRNPARPGQLVTHRVVDTRADDAGEVAYRTRGDANHVLDSAEIPHSQVVGSVRMVVPLVGLPALWVREGDLGLLGGSVALSAAAAAAVASRPRP